MARPRRQQQPHVERQADRSATPPMREEYAYEGETPEEARLGDFLVALVGRHILDTTDPMDPSMHKYWEWKAKQARDALTPQERVELRQRAQEFATRVMAEHERRLRAEAEGASTAEPLLDIE